jgi:hypothetical protein
MKSFDDLWLELPIPGEFDAMDKLDQERWRGVIKDAFDAGASMHDTRTRSQKLADAGYVRRPSLKVMEMRAALDLIAAPMRTDGTWNHDREACRLLAAEALGKYED